MIGILRYCGMGVEEPGLPALYMKVINEE